MYFAFDFTRGYNSKLDLSLRKDFELLYSVETVKYYGDFEVRLNKFYFIIWS